MATEVENSDAMFRFRSSAVRYILSICVIRNSYIILFDITILQDLEAREQMLIQNMKRNRRDCVDVEPRHSISLLNTTHTRIFPH